MKNGKTGRTKGNEFPWPGVCASLTGEGMDGILVKKEIPLALSTLHPGLSPLEFCFFTFFILLLSAHAH
jgi:hypothetical protein